MGLIIDSENIFQIFKNLYKSKYFVDKSNIIIELNKLIGKEGNDICITRPRRFGKTKIASLLVSYYSSGFHSKKIFDNLKVAKGKSTNIKERKKEIKQYKKNLGKYHVLYLDFSLIIKSYKTIYDYLNELILIMKKDLCEIFPNSEIKNTNSGNLTYYFMTLLKESKEQFIFIIDEWDFIFNENLFTKEERYYYLDFLRTLLKDKGYVALAYMTGVLPIAKQSSTSSLNFFKEYTIFNNIKYYDYFGFTESEVKELCKKNSKLNYKDLEKRYNGYRSETGERIFNSWSVYNALQNNEIDNYWTETGPMDEITDLIRCNTEDLRDDIVKLLSDENIKIKLERYSIEDKEKRYHKNNKLLNNENNSKIKLFSKMVAYGFLTYYQGYLSIPNKELKMKFEKALYEKDMGYIYELVKKSNKMLKATLNKDTKKIKEILEITHRKEATLFDFYNESSLRYLVKLAYISAETDYYMDRKENSGKGRLDIIFYPKDKIKGIVIIMELKIGKSAENVIKQIYEKKYYEDIRRKDYKGKVLIVGINCNKDKDHECIVEDFDKEKSKLIVSELKEKRKRKKEENEKEEKTEQMNKRRKNKK